MLYVNILSLFYCVNKALRIEYYIICGWEYEFLVLSKEKLSEKNKGLMKAGQCVDLMHLQIGQNGTFNK